MSFSLRRSLCLLCLLPTGIVLGQTTITSATDGTTPPGIAPGSPAGAYLLSGLDTINAFNGNLNFALPLLRVQGRGKAGYTISVSINQHWTIEQYTVYTTGVISSTYNTATPVWWHGGDSDPYGPGHMALRSVTEPDTHVACNGSAIASVTRLTFVEPDGTEHEFHDQLTNAKPLVWNNNYGSDLSGCVPGPWPDRGSTFVAMDGSGMTFVSDATVSDPPFPTTFARTGSSMPSVTGRLYFRDGTLYRFKNGVIEYIRDSNGNTIAFAYDPAYDRITSITDSMNRTVRLHYNVAANTPNPDSPSTLCPADATVGCDFITYGDPAAPRVITIVKTTHDNAFRACTAPDPCTQMYTLQDTAALFPGYSPNPETFKVDVLRRVILPDQRQYTFSYNAYAELARAQLPTGGAFEYDWGPGAIGELNIRQVLTRRVYSDGGTLGQGGTLERSETYSVPAGGNPPPSMTLNTVTTTGSSGQTIKIEQHSFYGSPAYYSLLPFNATPWQLGLEYQTDLLDSRGNLLRSTTARWTARPPFVNWTYASTYTPQPDSPIRCQENVTVDGNATSAKVYLYDQDKVSTALLTHYNNLTDVYEYGYGAAPALNASCYTATNIPGGYYRHTNSTYRTNGYDTSPNVHLLSLLQESVVSVLSGASEVPVGDTRYYYDEGGWTPRPGASTGREGLPAATDYDVPDAILRGNLTRVSRKLDTTGEWIDTSQTFDALGNVVSITDANNQTTQLHYDDQFTTSTQIPGGLTSYVFPTSVTNPLNQTFNTHYNYNIGKPEWFQDPNGATSTFTYNDPLDRMKSATSPNGGSVLFDYANGTGTTTITTTASLTASNDPAGCSANTMVSSTVFVR
jgi:YD repeat-containing protein